jgi:hypothetical protein
LRAFFSKSRGIQNLCLKALHSFAPPEKERPLRFFSQSLKSLLDQAFKAPQIVSTAKINKNTFNARVNLSPTLVPFVSAFEVLTSDVHAMNIVFTR